eukprot:4648898-Lingulodinium_polyedra.AAC.1
MAVAGGMSDAQAIAWVEETRTLSFDELGMWQNERFNRADVMLSQAFFQVVAKSNETVGA